jgi:hypothetical protein
VAYDLKKQCDRLDLAAQAADTALEILATLTAPEWAELASVARRHTAGELSPEAWRTFSEAVLSPALAEVERHGAIGVGLERGGNGKNGA